MYKKYYRHKTPDRMKDKDIQKLTAGTVLPASNGFLLDVFLFREEMMYESF